MMKLTVVGCSGSISGPDSPASSYLLQAPHEDRIFSLLIDCGPGAMGALYRYMDPCEIDAIALSHLHPDHCLDLCGYYVAARYSPNAPWPRRPVYAPADAGSRLARAYEVTGNQREVSESGVLVCRALRLAYLAAQPADRTVHRPHCCVLPIRSTHTESAWRRMCPAAAPWCTPATPDHPRICSSFADGVDLLLVESSFLDEPDNPPGMHLSGAQAAAIGTGRSSRCGSAHPHSALARTGACPRRSEATL